MQGRREVTAGEGRSKVVAVIPFLCTRHVISQSRDSSHVQSTTSMRHGIAPLTGLRVDGRCLRLHAIQLRSRLACTLLPTARRYGLQPLDAGPHLDYTAPP